MSDTLPPMTPLTPLGSATPRSDTHGPVTLTEETGTALASYSARLGHEDAARAALAAFVGHALPGPGASAQGDTFGTLWMGPDQWMVSAPHDSHETLAAVLADTAGGVASVTEQNDAWCRFDLSGDDLPAVFELLCPFDLRSADAGAATRTSIDHLGCFVITRAPDHVTVLGPRSSAGSLHHALLTAMRAAL